MATVIIISRLPRLVAIVVLAIVLIGTFLSFAGVVAAAPRRPSKDSFYQEKRIREQVDRVRHSTYKQREAEDTDHHHYSSNNNDIGDDEPILQRLSRTGDSIPKSAHWLRDQLKKGGGNNDIFNEQDVYIRPRHDEDDEDRPPRARRYWEEQRAQYARADMPHLESLLEMRAPHQRYNRRAPRFDTNEDDHINEISDRVTRLSERLRQHAPRSADDDIGSDTAMFRSEKPRYRRQEDSIDTEKLMQEMRDRQEQLRQQRERLRQEMQERYDRFHKRRSQDADLFHPTVVQENTTTNSKPAETVLPTNTPTTTSATATSNPAPVATEPVVADEHAIAEDVINDQPVTSKAEPAVAAEPVVATEPAVPAAAGEVPTKADSQATTTTDAATTGTATTEDAVPDPNAVLTAEFVPQAKTIETIAEPGKNQ